MNALGCVDTLAFGCETAESEKLLKTADAVCDIRVHDLIKKELEGGINYAAARENAVLKFYGDEISSVLTKPNNILAVEYIKAMKRLGSDMDIYPVFRKGAGHDELKENGEFASASALRILMERGDTAYRSFMPSATAEEFLNMKSVGRAPVCQDESERAILSRLRMLSIDDIKTAPDVSEGLENRIYDAIKTATSLEELYSIIKTKRYTHSRIRRIITSLYLGLKAEDTKGEIPYIRVIGFNERGREILREAKEVAKLPVIMKTSQIAALSSDAKHVFELECKATDLYNLATPRVLPCGTECSDEIVML